MTELLEPLEVLIRQAPWLMLAWTVFLGGCVGSFMNVVVYRVPAGQSLLHPGSRCPVCEHAIRWYDNVPVLGWLRLRGQCRDCHAAISPRYPLVEATVMLLFANQWIQDVHPVAATEPVWPAVFAFVWHISLMCVLICSALIDFDGHTVPASLMLFGAAVPIVLAFAWPTATSRLLHTADDWRVWEEVCGGAILAALVTFVLKPNFRLVRNSQLPDASPQGWTAVALSAMSGLYLGTGRALATLILTSLLWRLLRLIRVGPQGGAPWTWYLATLCWVAVAFPI